MSTHVLRGSDPSDADELGAALEVAFRAIKNAIANDDAVVVVVPSEDLLGHRSPVGAAYVNALIGMTRAVAFEGARVGWKINTVAVPSTSELTDRQAIDAVAADGLTGQVLTLGTALVGRLIP
ncbi:hypothetical protein [Nocardioides sp.]|jgi:hypothetical protein|uniref:hypothetical protein n=1 Tax=Nocardioides sp. TaxID=35761 RepID=UPI002A018781|nr:hypothetical protein [Nocardioides sp.]MCW2795705.1 hypothetical protein [Nocardioides sp.]